MQISASKKPRDSIREIYDQARNALKAGDANEAEMICRRALPVHGENPNILCLLGEILLKLKRPQQAQMVFGRVLGELKDYPRALEGVGLSLLAQRKPAKAARYLKKVVAAAPNRISTRIALGRALEGSGELDEADRVIAEAMALDPGKARLAKAAEAHSDGRNEEAIKLLQAYLAEHPESVTALRMLGMIALEGNRLPAARKMLGKVVELAPEFVLGWTELAAVLMKQDRFDEALEKVHRAVELDPDLPHPHVVKGNILTKAQRHEESLSAYRQALDLMPGNSGALAGMGHALKTIGRQEEAIEAFRTCIHYRPSFGEAYWNLANLKTFEFSPDEVEVMRQMVQEPELPEETRVNFLFSLGMHFENEKDYDRAFDAYRQGNELRRRSEVYDPVQTQVIHDRIIDVFTPDLFAKTAGSGNPDPSPILIVGLPRSGSTLIEQILASHSRVEGTMELPDLSRVIGRLNQDRRKHGEYPAAVRKLSAADLHHLGGSYLESTMRYRSGKPQFIDKMPNNFPSIGFLHLILPNAKVINARRHPLDSCLGSYKQLFFGGQSFTYDLFELGQYYLQYQRIMDHWHQVLPGKVLDVQYEDLVRDQEAQTRRILEHCGLPWEDQCLRFYETERAVNTASSEQVRQPIYTKALNFWRNYEGHLGELIDILAPLLRQLPPEDRPASLQS